MWKADGGQRLINLKYAFVLTVAETFRRMDEEGKAKTQKLRALSSDPVVMFHVLRGH